MTPDLILHNARLTTLDHENPLASAVAIQAGVFQAVGGARRKYLPLPGRRRASSTFWTDRSCRG
jgi:hypothetical protein